LYDKGYQVRDIYYSGIESLQRFLAVEPRGCLAAVLSNLVAYMKQWLGEPMAMSTFEDPKDEDRLCQVLRAYVEEWGPEHVIVSVPEHWREYSTTTLGRVALEFVTENSVSIRVEYDFVRVIYEVHLVA
jgi:hypothetical protein